MRARPLILIDQRIQVSMDTVVTTVEIMLDGNRAHATFASFPLDVLRNVTLRAK